MLLSMLHHSQSLNPSTFPTFNSIISSLIAHGTSSPFVLLKRLLQLFPWYLDFVFRRVLLYPPSSHNFQEPLNILPLSNLTILITMTLLINIYCHQKYTIIDPSAQQRFQNLHQQLPRLLTNKRWVQHIEVFDVGTAAVKCNLKLVKGNDYSISFGTYWGGEVTKIKTYFTS